MSDKSVKTLVRLIPFDRNDDISAIALEMDENMSTSPISLGSKFTFTVIGIERKEWEGSKLI